MRRNKPEIELVDLIKDIAESVASPCIELATVDSVAPTVLIIDGTYIRQDIGMLSGVAYAEGDKVAVEIVNGDYLILGKVVDAI